MSAPLETEIVFFVEYFVKQWRSDMENKIYAVDVILWRSVCPGTSDSIDANSDCIFGFQIMTERACL
jgi:hypothetical protein